MPKAFFKASAKLSTFQPSDPNRVAIALPDTKRHRDCIARIKPVFEELSIGVFWVSPNRSAHVEAPSEL